MHYVEISPKHLLAYKYVDFVKLRINSGMVNGNCVYWEEWCGDYTLDIYSEQIVMSPHECRNNNIPVISLHHWLNEYERHNTNFKIKLKNTSNSIDYFGLIVDIDTKIKYLAINKNGDIMGFDKRPILDTKACEFVNPIGVTTKIDTVESEGFNWEISLKAV